MAARPPKRTMTVLAVGLLLLDGVLLLIAAVYLQSWGMGVLGGLLIAMSAGVVLYYRRYVKTIAQVQETRETLKAELAELRRLIKERDQE